MHTLSLKYAFHDHVNSYECGCELRHNRKRTWDDIVGGRVAVEDDASRAVGPEVDDLHVRVICDFIGSQREDVGELLSTNTVTAVCNVGSAYSWTINLKHVFSEHGDGGEWPQHTFCEYLLKNTQLLLADVYMYM